MEIPMPPKNFALRVIYGLVLMLWITGTVFAQSDDPLAFPRPVQGEYDRASIEDIVLSDLPVLPQVTETAKLIYAKGQELGNIPNRFSKIGDCMTASEEFLHPFGTGDYDLGEYADLQSVVDYFSVPARDEGFEQNSFSNVGLGTASGFNTATLTDPLFADPTWCDANESSLTCEYRVTRSSFALIMLGTNDIMFFEATDFDFAMRNIVLDTMELGIVPILYTFPIRPEFPEKTDEFNKIIAKIAQDYDLPLVNLWLAIYDLPFNGVDEADPIHLSEPADEKTAILTPENLQFGYPVRNLITLQTLDIMLKELASDTQ
jgi:hypothetical protein